jgi:hypothetical protein
VTLRHSYRAYRYLLIVLAWWEERGTGEVRTKSDTVSSVDLSDPTLLTAHQAVVFEDTGVCTVNVDLINQYHVGSIAPPTPPSWPITQHENDGLWVRGRDLVTETSLRHSPRMQGGLELCKLITKREEVHCILQGHAQ